jgi:hypothetical protein
MPNYIGEKFRIPYPQNKAEQSKWSKNFGMNAYYAGKHWSIRKRDAEFWHMLVRSCMNGQEVRRIPFKRPVVITFRWNDRLDIDNHAVMGKMIVDAMKGRIIEDDNRRWLRGVCHYFHDEDYISVEIHEV